jgi:hypothetical protein
MYLPLDPAIAGHLGAPLIKQQQIMLLNERMANNNYSGGKRNIFYYYRSTGKRVIHLIEEELDGNLTAFQLFEKEAVKKPDLELLKAFKKKNLTSRICLVAPILDSWKYDGVEVISWESILDFNSSSRADD